MKLHYLKTIFYNSIINNIFIITFSLILFLISLNYYYIFIFYVGYLYYLYKKDRTLFLISIIISLITLIIFIIIKTTQNYYINNFNNTIIGKVIKLEQKQGYQKITLRYKIFKVIIKDYSSEYNYLRLGDIIKVEGTNLVIDTNHIPNAFNYKKYFYNNLYLYEIKSEKMMLINHKFSIYSLNKIVNDYLSFNFENESLIILKGFILGDISEFSDSLNNSLKINGIIHLFAISGSHIVLIISILEKFFNKSKDKTKIINTILFLYLLITRFTISITRAILTYYLNQIFKLLKINLTSLDISCVVFIILVFINPFLMYNLGFILSFASTFIIILISNYLKTVSNIKSIFIITIIINVFTLPFTINLNNEFNLLSPFINIIMILMVEGIIIPLSFIVVVFPILKIGYTYIIQGFINFNELIATISIKSGLVIRIESINSYFIFFYYLLLLFLFVSLKIKNLFSLLKTIIICILGLLILNINIIPSNQITFLDLYNGECTLIEYKNETILIDTGEGINNEVTSFLKSKGISKIDYLILTHNHSDHNGEASSIINNFNVKKIIISVYDNSIYSTYNNTIKIKKDSVLETKNIVFYCLSPSVKSNNENNNSLVLYFVINNIKFLFTGDIETEVEESLKKIKVDVLKVPHHGSISSTSNNFLNKTNPKYAIIMSGRSNKFTFPSNQIIERLNNINCEVYCTKYNYTIILKLKNKNKYEFQTLKNPNTFN